MRPFTDKQVELVRNFASQAVIAIENVRLLNETRDALERQTATAEILRVISSSPTDTQPVFDAIVDSGRKLFTGATISVALPDGDQVRAVAVAAADAALAQAWRSRFPFPLTHAYMHSRAILDAKMVDFPDVETAPPELAPGASNFLASGYRAVTIMPMRRGNSAIGAISVVRRVPGPLADKQLALLTTFADQAVIAIENTRLLKELRQRTSDLTESLEQQTATSGVLSVISSSPTNVQPVLDAIVKTAATLCASHDAVILLRDGEDLRIAAHHGPMALDFERVPIGPDWVAGSTVLGRVPVHVHDLAAEGADFPLGRQFARRLNQRTVLGLPLLREGQAIGCLFLRRTEVLPFTEKQIALLQTFADQAVIAIENTRLFEEVQARTAELTESLEYQTATSEVLDVISRSPSELQPVLDTIVRDRGAALLGGVRPSLSAVEGKFHLRCSHTMARSRATSSTSRATRLPSDRGSVAGRVAARAQHHSHADVLADPEYDRLRAAASRQACGPSLAVPLLREGELIGVIILARDRCRAVHRQADRAASKTFADQAVIAIENTRLFEEVQARTAELTESLEYQTATSEVLGVISPLAQRAAARARHHRRDRGTALQCRLQPDHSRVKDGTWYAASLLRP